jgi:hypothetical protein
VASAVKRGGRYGGRFMLAHSLVFAAFAGVLVFFAFLVARSDTSNAWAPYRPKGHDTYDKAQNMANFVAPRYVYGGSPIAVVQAQPLLFRDTPVDGIAFTRAPARNIGTHFRQFVPATADSTMTYVFCGQASKCGLPAFGATDVIPLLKRESLELALYTFKYWPDIDKVVALWPPATESSPAVYLKRSSLQRFLSKPLDETLPFRPQVTSGSLTAAELARVDRLTSDSVYPSSFQQAVNGRTLLLLGTGNR